MEGLGSVVFLLAMGVVWLLSQVFQHIGKRKLPAQASATEPEEVPASSDAVGAVSKGVRPPRSRRPIEMRKAHPTTEMSVAARRLVTGRASLRRAVIVMTVLGPPVSHRASDANTL